MKTFELDPIDKKSCVLDLLPISKNTIFNSPKQILEVLLLCKNLIEILAEGIKSFVYSNILKNFDGHVGDCSCQSRAFLLIFFKKNLTVFEKDNLKDDFSRALFLSRKIDNLIKKHTNKRFKPQTLEYYFCENSINFHMTQLSFYLASCKFLTSFKIYDIRKNYLIDYKMLQQFFHISKTKSRKLIHYYQKIVSYQSQKMLSNIIKKNFGFIHNELFIKFLRYDEEDRLQSPTYLLLYFLLKLIIIYDIPICIKERYSYDLEYSNILVFRWNKNLKTFSLVRSSVESLPFVFVFETVFRNNSKNATGIDLINEIGLKELIYCSMVNHPQYSGQILKKYKYDPYKADSKKLEKINGFESFYEFFKTNKNNINLKSAKYIDSTYYFIKHIYCCTGKELASSGLIEYNKGQKDNS